MANGTLVLVSVAYYKSGSRPFTYRVHRVKRRDRLLYYITPPYTYHKISTRLNTCIIQTRKRDRDRVSEREEEGHERVHSPYIYITTSPTSHN